MFPSQFSLKKSRRLAIHSNQCIINSAKNNETNSISNIKNETLAPQFYPLIKVPMSIFDGKFIYLTHGTFLDNLESIMTKGLDPSMGGRGHLGAASYEGFLSSDAYGLMKYSTDPNISLKYAMGPAANMGKIGVQLQIRIDADSFVNKFNNASVKGDPNPFWREERGGENNAPCGSSTVYLNSWLPKLPKNETGKGIWSLETNIPVKPCDIRVIGVAIPPGEELNIDLVTSYLEFK